MLVTVTCISLPIDMGDQIGGVMWFSSGIIFGSCCDGELWLGQVKYVPFSLILAQFEAGNHHHQVLKLEPLEVWHHRGIDVGYGVCSVATCTSYTHYNVIDQFVILWIIFLSLWLKPWLLFPVDDKVEYLQDLVD